MQAQGARRGAHERENSDLEEDEVRTLVEASPRWQDEEARAEQEMEKLRAELTFAEERSLTPRDSGASLDVDDDPIGRARRACEAGIDRVKGALADTRSKFEQSALEVVRRNRGAAERAKRLESPVTLQQTEALLRGRIAEETDGEKSKALAVALETIKASVRSDAESVARIAEGRGRERSLFIGVIMTAGLAVAGVAASVYLQQAHQTPYAVSVLLAAIGMPAASRLLEAGVRKAKGGE